MVCPRCGDTVDQFEGCPVCARATFEFDTYRVGWVDGYLACKKDSGTTPLDSRATGRIETDYNANLAALNT